LVVARFFDDFLPAHGSASTGYNHTRQFPVGQGLEAIRGRFRADLVPAACG
jgi:hypothetical protein